METLLTFGDSVNVAVVHDSFIFKSGFGAFMDQKLIMLIVWHMVYFYFTKNVYHIGPWSFLGPGAARVICVFNFDIRVGIRLYDPSDWDGFNLYGTL